MNQEQKVFKPQFGDPFLLVGGSVKNKDRYGGSKKTYQPSIATRRYIVWASNKQMKTASEAIEYAKALLARYTRLVDVAIRLSQNIQLDADYLEVIKNADKKGGDDVAVG